MPSTFTPRLRLEDQANGENANTWGDKTDNNWAMIEQAVAGVRDIVVTGNYTLTTLNASTDDARSAVLIFRGALSAPASITVPNVEKTYIVVNDTTGGQNLVFTTGTGTTITAKPGDKLHIYSTGDNELFEVAGSVPEFEAEFPSGTSMVFYQSVAPTGWTQNEAVNDQVLRVVSGSGGATGGSWTISGLTNGDTGSTTLTTSQIPAHNHTGSSDSAGGHQHSIQTLQFDAEQSTKGPHVTSASGGQGHIVGFNTDSAGGHTHTLTTNNTGGGEGHVHGGSTISSDGNWRPAYIDVIVAVKN